jgi:PKD repeat protein
MELFTWLAIDRGKYDFFGNISLIRISKQIAMKTKNNFFLKLALGVFLTLFLNLSKAQISDASNIEIEVDRMEDTISVSIDKQLSCFRNILFHDDYHSNFPFNTDTSNIIIWTGTNSSDWNNYLNWNELRLPKASDNVIIPQGLENYPFINTGESGDCYNLTVDLNAKLTLQSGGSLITLGEIANSGQISVDRKISGNQWHMIAVSDNITNASMIFGTDLFYFDEPTVSWINITGSLTPLIPGRGYGYALWDIIDTTLLTFNGTPNTGNISHDFTSESEFGWNLMGNPYPSSIDWDLVIADQQGLNYALYFWDASIGNSGQYLAYVPGFGISRYIPPQQGFFVSAHTAGNLYLKNEHRVHYNSQGFFKESMIADHSIELDLLENNKIMDKFYFRFNEDATDAFDFKFDALKIEAYEPMLFTRVQNNKLCIDQRPQCESIQLGFKCDYSGYFKFQLVNAFSFVEVIIHDTKEATFYDILQTEYEFWWSEYDDENRFNLKLTKLGLDFFASATDICEFEIISFLPDTSMVIPDSIFWSFPGGNPDYSSQLEPEIKYPEEGTFDVTMTAYYLGDTLVVNKTDFIQVNALPTIPTKPQGEDLICFNQNSSGYATNLENVIWQIEPAMAGSISYSDSTCIIYWNEAFHGEAQLSVQSFNNCGTSELSESLTITRIARPDIDFVATPLFIPEAPYEVQFTNLTPNPELYNFTWHFGNGDTSEENEPFYTYAESGLYAVSLVAEHTETGCSDTLTKADFIQCSAAGVTDNQKDGFRYFVNQTDKTLQLIFDEQPDGYAFNLLGIDGKYFKTILLTEKVSHLSLNDLSPGVYVFMIKADDKHFSGKIIF